MELVLFLSQDARHPHLVNILTGNAGVFAGFAGTSPAKLVEQQQFETLQTYIKVGEIQRHADCTLLC